MSTNPSVPTPDQALDFVRMNDQKKAEDKAREDFERRADLYGHLLITADQIMKDVDVDDISRLQAALAALNGNAASLDSVQKEAAKDVESGRLLKNSSGYWVDKSRPRPPAPKVPPVPAPAAPAATPASTATPATSAPASTASATPPASTATPATSASAPAAPAATPAPVATPATPATPAPAPAAPAATPAPVATPATPATPAPAPAAPAATPAPVATPAPATPAPKATGLVAKTRAGATKVANAVIGSAPPPTTHDVPKPPTTT